MVREDRISKWPNDILISIISRLNIKEATSTSVLSTCWRYLHHYVHHLDFPKYRYGIHDLSNYVSMVDHVLESHRGSRIKELVVDMYDHDHRGYNGHFEKWFDFALTKKAEIIHLDSVHQRHECPFLRLTNPNGLKCVKDLYLSEVTMTDQDFELLVSNCLSLECFTIESPSELSTVSIVGLSKLKYVNLSDIWEVESIVICDVISLVSLKLYNLSVGCVFQLSNIPKLAKLDFQESCTQLMLAEFLAKIPSRIHDQLQLMRLSTKSHNDFFPHGVDLVNIQHLELVLDIQDSAYDSDLLSYAFSTEMCYSKMLDITQRCSMFAMYFREVGDIELPIKYFEITGYLGSTWERKLASYVIRNATALQNLTVVSCDQGALSRARLDFQHTPSVHYSVGATFSGQDEFYEYEKEKQWWTADSPTSSPSPPATSMCSTSCPQRNVQASD
ncbi:F-box/FBD/LRR-repeat protein-like protein [Salvia divinorum]|uniref:F-box/FBD/LRR-repeat protein-like protein n=1 Tax=Salvia divinorum TaxID=28513 RepID=A0ABD1G8E0_SALDI